MSVRKFTLRIRCRGRLSSALIPRNGKFFMICFKLEAGFHLLLSGRPLNQIATDLGIQPSMLRSWQGAVNGQKVDGAMGSVLAAAPSAEQAEVRRLRRELGRAQMIRDFYDRCGLCSAIGCCSPIDKEKLVTAA